MRNRSFSYNREFKERKKEFAQNIVDSRLFGVPAGSFINMITVRMAEIDKTAIKIILILAKNFKKFWFEENFPIAYFLGTN